MSNNALENKLEVKSIKDKHLNMDILEKQLETSFKSINKFYNKIEEIPIRQDLKPGFIYDKYIKNYPENPEEFDSILNDFEKDVFPNLCLWQHPSFFAYYQAPTSHHAITLEMISTAMHTPNFNWNVSPAAHELEWVVMEWLVKMLGIGKKFSFENGGCGGCVTSTTEGIFLSVNQAKYKKIKELKLAPTDPRRLRFAAYYPYTNKDWAEKALEIKEINFKRCLEVHINEETGNYNINPDDLKEKIKADIEEGLIPLWYGGQIGATSCGASDQFEIIGPILKEFGIYLNVDAAHAGLFSILPEYRIKGIEYINNICVNMVKSGMAVNQACLMFNDDKHNLILSTGAINGEIYRTNEEEGIKINYKDFSIGFGRRMAGIKLYGMLKSIGVTGYQEYLRVIIERGDYFLKLIRKNPRFEIFVKPAFGLICFRLAPLNGNSLEEYNETNIRFHEKMKIKSEDGFVSSSSVNGINFLRFVAAVVLTEEKHIDKLFEKMQQIIEVLDVEMN